MEPAVGASRPMRITASRVYDMYGLMALDLDTLVSARTPLTLSAAAARRIRDLGQAEGRPLMLRVAVDGGGCSGFQYQFDLVESGEPDDLRIERDGGAGLIDEGAL